MAVSLCVSSIRNVHFMENHCRTKRRASWANHTRFSTTVCQQVKRLTNTFHSNRQMNRARESPSVTCSRFTRKQPGHAPVMAGYVCWQFAETSKTITKGLVFLLLYLSIIDVSSVSTLSGAQRASRSFPTPRRGGGILAKWVWSARTPVCWTTSYI